MKKRTVMTFAAAAALALSIGCAAAAETDSYSYLAGRQRSVGRNDLYAQAEQLPEDERDAFLAENGIGDTPYSEEAASSYSYVAGQQRGAAYGHDDETGEAPDLSGYSFYAGKARGAGYRL